MSEPPPPNPRPGEPSNLGFLRVFRYRDFRLLWLGAFFSFTGSWVQSVAQGYLVYELTHDKALLALVSFAGSIPVTFLGPFAGTLVDKFDRRKLLVSAQLVLAAGALFLAASVYYGFARYELIVAVALISGLIGCVEMPARQSVIGRVVPPEDLSTAIPLNALTFNMARLVGPAIGGILLAAFGAGMCYLVNGLSFATLVFAALAIRSDLTAEGRNTGGVLALAKEGLLYTLREPRLRTLLILEASISVFALHYIALLPALAKDVLGLDQRGLGLAYSSIGIGAVTSLLLIAWMSARDVKGTVIRLAMLVLGSGLVGLSFIRSSWLAMGVLSALGLATVAQFNTTNALFQILSPDYLRGRVISMHIWALSGLSPIGTLLFGLVAQKLGLAVALWSGGAAVLAFGLWSWTQPSMGDRSLGRGMRLDLPVEET